MIHIARPLKRFLLALFHLFGNVTFLFFYYGGYSFWFFEWPNWEKIRENLWYDVTDESAPDLYESPDDYFYLSPKYRVVCKTPLDTLLNRKTKIYL